ncbi:LOW QUALITY PROTEIN: F-box and leucine-rich repeat protein 13 [Pluvialis apricaria]
MASLSTPTPSLLQSPQPPRRLRGHGARPHRDHLPSPPGTPLTETTSLPRPGPPSTPGPAFCAGAAAGGREGPSRVWRAGPVPWRPLRAARRPVGRGQPPQFGGWIKYNLLKKNKRKKAKQKMALAVVHYNIQILRVVYWSMWVQIHKKKMTLAVKRLQQIFNKIHLNAVVKAWHADVHSSLKTKAYFESLAKESRKGWFESDDLTFRYKTSHLPETALLQLPVVYLHSNSVSSWCKDLQDVNLSECQGLNVNESMRLISEVCRALLLNLLYTDITNGTLQLLSSFPNLQYLSLAHCRKFRDKGLLYLGSGKGCHKLIYLDLSGCIQISVNGFRNVANGCNRIQDLLINKMPVLIDRCIQALFEKYQQIVSVVFLDSDTTFTALAECKLVKVSIDRKNQITHLSFKLMSKWCPYIRHIHVAGCQRITNAALQMISPLKHLLVLNVADCIRISDGSVRPFVQGSSGTKLRELNLTNCIDVTGASVTEIAQRCHELTYLNLRYCENMIDAGTEALGNMSPLISIDISGTSISDMGLRALSCHGKIKELSISEHKTIRDTGIHEFCKGTKYLEHCHVSYCPPLMDEAVKAVPFHCHTLTSVNTAGCPEVDIKLFVHNNSDNRSWDGDLPKVVEVSFTRCRQAVLKYTAKLEKQEHNDTDLPSWFGYDQDGNIFTFTKKHTSEPE